MGSISFNTYFFQSPSIQNSAPSSTSDEICIRLFEGIIINSLRAYPLEQIKSDYKLYLEQFFKIYTKNCYQEQVEGFTTSLETFFLPRLKSLSLSEQYLVFFNTIYLMNGCETAQNALYQILRDELPRLKDSAQEGSLLFVLLDYFWNEDWESLCYLIPSIATPQQSEMNQVLLIAAIENMRKRGLHPLSIENELKRMVAWNWVGLSTHDINMIYILFTTEGKLPDGHPLGQKYPLLTSFYLLKRGHLNFFTSSPFIWKLVMDCRQKKTAFSAPLQAIQISARPSQDLLSSPQKTDLTSRELPPPLPEPIMALYNDLKNSAFENCKNLFSNVPLNTKFKQGISQFVLSSNSKVDIKQRYDLYHAFWYVLLESIQEKLIDPEHTLFMNKASYLIKVCKGFKKIDMAVAFITALLRLNPSPIHLFLIKNGFSEELYTHFWKGKSFKKFALQHTPTLNLLQLLCILDPTQFFNLKWKSQIPKDFLTLFKNLSNVTASKRECFARQNKLTILASYYSITIPTRSGFHPILLIEFLSYCSEMLSAHGNATFAKELLGKTTAAAKRGKPLSAPDTVWIEDQSPLFAQTDPCICLQNLLRDIKAFGENWMIKDSDQQKAFIRSQSPKLSEMNVGKLYHFFAIPEHLGCYSSQAHLVELKRDFPKFFDYCQQQQPKNPFIQLP